MKIIINGRIRIKNCPEWVQQNLIEELRLENPLYSAAIKAGRSTYGINKFINNFIIMSDSDILIPRGMRSYLMDTIKNESFEIIDNRVMTEFIQVDSKDIILRPYQFTAINNIVTNIEEGMLISPAGSGKTVMGLSLIPILGQKTLWLTHTGPLLEQTRKRAESMFPSIGNIGIIGQGENELGNILTIGMVQTLAKNKERLIEINDKFGLVIIDEAHHAAANTFLDVVSSLKPYYLYGLTATPFRGDGLDQLMFQSIGTEKIEITTKDVANYGGIILPSIKCRYLNTGNDSDNNISRLMRKYIVTNNNRNDIIVKDVIEEAKTGHFCIVVCGQRNHCKILYDKIKKRWDMVGIATGKYNKDHIKETVDLFNNKEISILVTTFSLMGEGFDVPFIDRAFIAAPFRSKSRIIQLIGRVQRTYPGKNDAMVYDYVDKGIGIFENQFKNNWGKCRLSVYKELGVAIV